MRAWVASLIMLANGRLHPSPRHPPARCTIARGSRTSGRSAAQAPGERERAGGIDCSGLTIPRMLASPCDVEARRFAIRWASTGKTFHTRFLSCLRCASEVLITWWAVLGSNQWPLSFDIAQCHDRTVPELSQVCRVARQSGCADSILHNWSRLLLACSGLHDALHAPVVGVAVL
jgi:hypothetical protein